MEQQEVKYIFQVLPVKDLEYETVVQMLLLKELETIAVNI